MNKPMNGLTTALIAAMILCFLAMPAAAAGTGDNGGNNTTVNTTSANNTEGGLAIPGLPELPQLPEVNMSDVGEKLGNATKTGVEPVDDVTKFLADASPFLLLIAGVVVILLAGFGRIIGIILIIIAVIRLIQMMFF